MRPNVLYKQYTEVFGIPHFVTMKSFIGDSTVPPPQASTHFSFFLLCAKLRSFTMMTEEAGLCTRHLDPLSCQWSADTVLVDEQVVDDRTYAMLSNDGLETC